MRSSDGLSRRSTFLLVTLIVIVSTLAITAYTLWRLRSETISRHFDVANMYARSFENHLTHTFNVIDLTLDNVGDDARNPDALARALRRAPYLRSLAVVDRRGVVVVSSDPQNLGVVIDRKAFLPVVSDPRAVLRAGSPWVGRDFHDARQVAPDRPATPEAQTLIPVLRDLAREDEPWISIAATVNPDYFINYHDRNLIADQGSVDVFRYDGVLLFSSDPSRLPGSRIGDATLLSRITSEEFGDLEQGGDNQSAVLTAFRASPTFPLAVVVNLDKASVLADWRREVARTTTVVFAVLLIALAMATLYFVRLERTARRHDADLEKLRVRSAALKAAANAIIITDRAGTIEWANPAFCVMSGYSPDEVIGRNPRALIKSGLQSVERYQDLWRTISAGNVWQGELINRRKDGSSYPEDQTITPVRDENGEIRHFIAVKQDITERKRAEKRVAELSQHLVVAQESARRRLSGELHDRTSPNLAAIGINLEIIGTMVHAEDSSELSTRLDDVRALIEDTTASIREISSDLRPPVLDFAGLVAALESYIKQFQRRTGMTVGFACFDRALRLAPTVESMLFRIVQEALTNCAKHSGATHIAVTLSRKGADMVLSISDNGAGFDPAREMTTTHTGGLGILTMQEMAEFSGGRFALVASPGSGVTITVVLPLVERVA